MSTQPISTNLPLAGVAFPWPIDPTYHEASPPIQTSDSRWQRAKNAIINLSKVVLSGIFLHGHSFFQHMTETKRESLGNHLGINPHHIHRIGIVGGGATALGACYTLSSVKKAVLKDKKKYPWSHFAADVLLGASTAAYGVSLAYHSLLHVSHDTAAQCEK